MIFGRVPLAQAAGGILAHSLKAADQLLRKGALIDAEILAMLARAGYAEVTIARLEPGDMPEGAAARYLGERLAGPALQRSPDIHGRVNLIAQSHGLLRVDPARIDQLNQIDEAVTLATLADRSIVAPDDIVATLKIIPFAVRGQTIDALESLIAQGGPALALKPFQPQSVGLILSRLPQLKPAALTHTIEATAQRVTARGGKLLPPLETPHETASIHEAIKTLLAAGADMILISGASAVTDRMDIAPQAIVQAGGEITHFGMPVDPGNLICFGQIGNIPAIVLPGCARSPAPNGIDWVLDLLFAGEPIGPGEIARLGVGGLLKEIASRPVPRNAQTSEGFGAPPPAPLRIASLVLAAGQSTRMPGANKLLAPMPGGQPMIAQTVDRIIAGTPRPIIIVTGHQENAIRHALQGRPVRFVHAADYAAGLSASLHAGIAALSSQIDAALICLGDMPLLDPALLNQLLGAYDPAQGREIIIPTFEGQRGNPVLWGKRFFPELLNLDGDIGARQILHLHPDAIAEIQVETDAVLLDFDTPAALATLAK